MKLNQSVTLSTEEVSKMLTKFVEKKLGKKVTSVAGGEDGSYVFNLEESEVEEKKEG